MNRYRVKWRHDHPMWGEVMAESEEEAIGKAKAGDFIKDTVDSDPGQDVWKKVKVEEIS